MRYQIVNQTTRAVIGETATRREAVRKLCDLIFVGGANNAQSRQVR